MDEARGCRTRKGEMDVKDTTVIEDPEWLYLSNSFDTIRANLDLKEL